MKFVGKFRKNKDYNDDYNYAKTVLHNKKRRSVNPEIKHLRNRLVQEEEIIDDIGMDEETH